MAKILCFDTSSDFLSIALACNNQILSEHKQIGQSHGLHLPAAIDQLLAKAGIQINQLDALAFGRGPGSFTGIRIAASFAHGIAMATNLGLIPISNLAALAKTAHRLTAKTYFLTAIDAKIGEIYWAEYQATTHGLIELITEEQISKPEAIKAQLLTEKTTTHYTTIGTGFCYQENMPTNIKNLPNFLKQPLPYAEDMLTLAIDEYNKNKLLKPEQAIPIYLKNVQ